MSDDGGIGSPPLVDHGDPELLQYDFAKYLSTLALLLLGGVLTLSQGEGGAAVERSELVSIIALLAVGGVSALANADAIVQSRVRGRPRSRWARLLPQLSMALIGIGTGTFLAAWLNLLK